MHSVPLEGGGHLGCNRRRPMLLMNAEGTPTHLYTGCRYTSDLYQYHTLACGAFRDVNVSERR